MTTRMTVRRVTFFRQFRLAGADGTFPAGSYRVETDEDTIEDLSFTAYRRTATYITVPGASAGMSHMVRVEPPDLDVILNLGLETALARSSTAELSDADVNALIDDPTIQSAIFSARLTLTEFRNMIKEFIEERRQAGVAASDRSGDRQTGSLLSDRLAASETAGEVSSHSAKPKRTR
jgi:hypothetical protein